MEINIKEERENPLLNRKEVYFLATFTGATPSRKEVKSALSNKLGADLNKIVIDKLTQEYGKTEMIGYAKVYRDEESMKIEREYKLIRDTKVKEKKETPK